MARVYKICPRAEWEAAVAAGQYHGSAIDRRDGYVHLSTGEQVEGTRRKHFGATTDLVLVAFESEALGSALRFERSRDGQLFPHFYGPLPVSLAVDVSPIPPLDSGTP